MKKLKGLIASIVLCFGILLLAACGGKSSGITEKDVDMQVSAITKNSATIKLTFTENDNLANGNATAYVSAYKITDDAEEFHQRKDVSFTGDVYTSSTVSFTSLETDTEYEFVLYVTFNKANKKIKSIKATPTSNVSSEIATTQEFKDNLVNDTDGEFVLTSDLNFEADGEKESLSLFSTEAKAFMGTLDGGIYENGQLVGCHKISNFKLGSATYCGLFGYLKNATIKNLIIENVVVDYTSKSSSSIGALAGYAISSYVENVQVNNVSFKISASTSAEQNTGGIVGYSKRTTFKNIIGDNIDINYTSAKIKINVGLFAGKITGDALIDDITAESCGVTGKITLVNDFTTSSGENGYIYVGGFVGSLSAIGEITDCYANVDTVVSTNRQNGRIYDVYVGGFVGANGPESTTMYITKSLALVKQKIYGGPISTDQSFDYSTYESDYYLATNKGYIGGFIGKATGVFRGITDSYAMLLEDPEIYATPFRVTQEADAEHEEQSERVLFSAIFIGDYAGNPLDKNTYLPDCDDHVIRPGASIVPTVLSETLQELITSYID